MTAFLRYEQQGHIVTLTMNDPEKRNPLTGNSAVDEFIAAIDQIHRDKSVRAVVLTGAGPTFSAGGNLKALQELTSSEVSALDIRDDYRAGIQRLPMALFHLEVPVIAAVNGPAVGAGLDLACMCDIRIASTQARFAESFVKLGLISGDGGAWLLPRVIGLSRAAEMTFTGDVIDADTALQWNLVSQVVAPDQLLSTAHALAERIAANPTHAVRMSKRLIREALHARLDSVLELASTYQAMSHLTPENREAITAFFEKRKPVF